MISLQAVNDDAKAHPPTVPNFKKARSNARTTNQTAALSATTERWRLLAALQPALIPHLDDSVGTLDHCF